MKAIKLKVTVYQDGSFRSYLDDKWCFRFYTGDFASWKLSRNGKIQHGQRYDGPCAAKPFIIKCLRDRLYD